MNKFTSIWKQPGKEEIEFFNYCKDGELPDLSNFLKKNKTFNVNARNMRNQTGLTLAIQNEHLHIVEYLLPRADTHQEDVLYAVDTHNVDLVKLVTSSRNLVGVLTLYSLYPDGETPLIVAALNNDYHMIAVLLEKGYRLQQPHSPKCKCKVCEDSTSTRRLRMYRAVGSHAYICQTEQDPILRCFILTNILRTCTGSNKNIEHKEEYEQLSISCENLSHDLLNLCRSRNEILALLDRQTGNDRRDVSTLGCPRAGLALAYSQKQFVANDRCQEELSRLWCKGYERWLTMSLLHKALILISRVLLFPLIALVQWLFPAWSYLHNWTSPVHKCMMFAASYVWFIVALFLHNHSKIHGDVRGPPTTGIEIFIIIYIQSLMLMEFKIWRETKANMHSITAQRWRLYNGYVIAMFQCLFLMWLYLLGEVMINHDYYRARRYWNQYDPILITEIVYSVIQIFTWWSIFYILQVFHGVALLTVSFGRMLTSVFFFIFIFYVIVFGFASSLFTMYQNYRHATSTIDGKVKVQIDHFTYFIGAVNSMFWSLFGYSPNVYADIVVPEYYEIVNGHAISKANEHPLILGSGYLIYALCNQILSVVMKNMFVALLKKDYEYILQNKQVECRFAKSKMWITFFTDQTTLPPPFNLIPSPYYIYTLVKRLCKTTDSKETEELKRKLLSDEDDVRTYEMVIANIVQRYYDKFDTDPARRKGLTYNIVHIDACM